jgi:tetratricopeptide (TPR) repeat protein
MVKTLAKWLVLVLALDLFVGGCPTSFAQNDDPRSLIQQFDKMYQSGEYQEAIPIAEKILAIAKRVLGPEHPGTAGSLCNLANLYYQMGDYAKAEPLYQQALQIQKKVLGNKIQLTVRADDNALNLGPQGSLDWGPQLGVEAFQDFRKPFWIGSITHYALIPINRGVHILRGCLKSHSCPSKAVEQKAG